MSDIEEGPYRRLSKGRRKKSSPVVVEELSSAGKRRRGSGQTSEGPTSALQDVWFANSFQRAHGFANKLDPANHCKAATTPQPKRRKSTKTNIQDELNTSDTLLADMDIETITSQALSQSQIAFSVQNNNCSKGTKENAELSQVDYKRFRNYKPTQPLGNDNSRQESSKPSSCTEDSFSFSFVGEHTVCEESYATQSSNSKQCEIQQSYHNLRNKPANIGPAFAKSDVYSCKRTDLVSSVPLKEVNVTDESFEGSQLVLTCVDTTQLKDSVGVKYRCTPFQRLLPVGAGQPLNQTQSDLVSGTQYNSILHESCSGSQFPKEETQNMAPSQACQIGKLFSGSQLVESQIPGTGVMNMTGVFVESQEDNDAANTSSDMFDERVCEENDRGNPITCNSVKYELTPTQQDCGIASHTQSLICDDRATSDLLNSQVSNSKDKDHEKVTENDNKKQQAFVQRLIKNSAVTYGDSSKMGNNTLSSNPVTVLCATPGTSSLQEKIKKRLVENAGKRTPQGLRVIGDQLREQVLEKVQLEVEILKERSSLEVGPFYGLPTLVKNLLHNHRGISSLYDWQEECLQLPALARRGNLVYSLPTSGGKTLVAEILILKELLCHKRDALLILPFVSIVQEKVRNMSIFAVDLNFYVEEYAGSKGRFPPIKRQSNRSLYIATIEKAQSIVNSLIETDRIENLGLVVLHMLGEGGSRGSCLEATLLKVMQRSASTQIIGMSATLNNIGDITKFLDADVYSNDFRPVELTEYVKVSDNIFQVLPTAKCPEDQFVHQRVVDFQYRPEMLKLDPDQLLGLILEVIPDNSCLFFCATKKICESMAKMMSKLLATYRSNLAMIKQEERKALLKELYSDSEGKMCPVLRCTLQFGIAYHHSGLTTDERKLIEEAYSAGTLCLLTCTSTLAAGVNLPAKRVILGSPYIGRNFMTQSQYKQMVGRAGRAGIDTSGESILICKQEDRAKVMELLSAPLESCHSSLVYEQGRGLRAMLLSVIGLKVATTTEEVFRFVARSLASIQQAVLGTDVTELCQTALQKLVDSGLILQTRTLNEDPQGGGCEQLSLTVTPFGRATFKGPIDPDFASMLYNDLTKAEESIVLSTHLHLLYLVTPYDLAKDASPNWFIYLSQFSTLSASEMKVASLIGVPESYLVKRSSNMKSRVKVDEFVVNRFYLTLMLYDLWREKSVWEVAERFDTPRGFVQNLLASAASFASCVAHFCMELEEFWAYQDLLGNFVKRLSYCVTAELIPLMEIPGIKLGRARMMFAAGYKTLSSVASASPDELVKAVQFMPRKVARQVVASAKLLLNEKKDAMMAEVEALVTVPSGVNAVPMATIPTPAPITPGLDSQESTTDSYPTQINMLKRL
ncbi:hypothetical protein DPMN_098225 [Dreissena polymorpha]|uniref:Helicase POLQ-like n=1 Tax=Dreissena polymorpha TaxID=45954 RepID=A0A9D4LCM3_DREPO|nr:hypothetical protein DPMN_098225 [Dreissena polymorpha]